MIGVDTNVLVRLFVLDNQEQHRRAVSFFAERSVTSPAFVSCVVLVELFWLLTGRFGYSSESVCEVIQSLLDSPDFVVEHPAHIDLAIRGVVEKKVDFADYVISVVARLGGCESVVTFDKRAAKHVYGMDLLN